MNKLYRNFLKTLKHHNIYYEEISHVSVFTSNQANEISGVKYGEGLKTIALSTKKLTIVITLKDDEKINFSNLNKHFGVKFSFLKEEYIHSKLQSELGGLPPFGYSNNIKCYISKQAKQLSNFEINPGVNYKTIKLDSSSFLKLIELFHVEEIREELEIIDNKN